MKLKKSLTVISLITILLITTPILSKSINHSVNTLPIAVQADNSNPWAGYQKWNKISGVIEDQYNSKFNRQIGGVIEDNNGIKKVNRNHHIVTVVPVPQSPAKIIRIDGHPVRTKTQVVTLLKTNHNHQQKRRLVGKLKSIIHNGIQRMVMTFNIIKSIF